MMILRPATLKDTNGLHALAQASDTGITTLPKNRDLLRQRLQWSTDSFSQQITQPVNEYYWFVLENTATKAIIGSSAIEACTGYNMPFYSYLISQHTYCCPDLGIRTDHEVLSLVNNNQGKSELCTLFLSPDFRHSTHGLLLSRGRFLFMANNPARFSAQVIAEMRGMTDANGVSAFWEHVGRHFFQISFAKADRLTLSTNKQFIADLMPQLALYTRLLDKQAQAVIGKPHTSTQAAMTILLREGFRPNHCIDIFDAGPTLEAPFHGIKTLAESQVFTIEHLTDEVISSPYLLATSTRLFRAMIGQVLFNTENQTCLLSQETADLLQVGQADRVRIAPLYPKVLTELSQEVDNAP